jgi:hypothetical protein
MNDKGLRLFSGRALGFPRLFACALAALCLFGTTPVATSAARRRQQETAVSLGLRSSIVLRGSVARLNASDEPQLAPTANTVVVKVSRMYIGSEIAGDQAGRDVTVILSRTPRFKVGDEAVFFGNPRFVGKSLTIADEGEIPAADARASTAEVERGVRARRDVPVRMRLAVADLVFRGKVEEVRPLDAPNAAARERESEPSSEHDPEWRVASVRVETPLRGVKDGTVLIIFPASRDIMWFNSPKLQPGQEAVFIAHRPLRDELPLLRATGVLDFLRRQPAAELVTYPYDVLPATEEARVRELLTKEVR